MFVVHTDIVIIVTVVVRDVVVIFVVVIGDIDAVAVVGFVDLMMFFKFMVDGVIIGLCCNGC